MCGEWLQGIVDYWDTVDDGENDRAQGDKDCEIDRVGQCGEKKGRKEGHEESG